MLILLAAANMFVPSTSTNIDYNDVTPVTDLISTKLYEEFNNNELALDLSSYLGRNQLTSTQIEISNDSDINSSTWSDWNENNFDVFSNLKPKKSYTLKSKIISVTKFTPKIVIE